MEATPPSPEMSHRVKESLRRGVDVLIADLLLFLLVLTRPSHLPLPLPLLLSLPSRRRLLSTSPVCPFP